MLFRHHHTIFFGIFFFPVFTTVTGILILSFFLGIILPRIPVCIITAVHLSGPLFTLFLCMLSQRHLLKCTLIVFILLHRRVILRSRDRRNLQRSKRHKTFLFSAIFCSCNNLLPVTVVWTSHLRQCARTGNNDRYSSPAWKNLR